MGESTDLVQLLQNTYLLGDLTPSELQSLVPNALLRRYRRGEYVFQVGDPAAAVHVVASGQLKETVVTADGEEIVFEVFTAGAVFGEPGLFARERNRVVGVVAMHPSEVVAIPREPLLDFLLAHPPAMLRMLEGLAAQVRTSVVDMSSVAFRKIQERLVLKLLELAETHGDASAPVTTIRLQLPQATLAAMIGASRENVNRALTLLAEAGEITTHEAAVVILDPEALRRRAGVPGPLLHRRNRRFALAGGTESRPRRSRMRHA